MNRIVAQVRSIIALGARATAVTLMLSGPAMGQTGSAVNGDNTIAKLEINVHLQLDDTTAEKLMTVISEQLGLTVKTSEYLAERKLTVRMDNISASKALNAIAELNDWAWYVNKPGEVLVTRRRLKINPVPAYVTRQMQAAIPQDIRTFLDIPMPTDNTPENYVNIFNGALRSREQTVHDRLWASIASDQRDLLSSLPRSVLTGRPIAISKLTPLQKGRLLSILILPALIDMPFQLLHGDVPPYVADIKSSVLKLSGPDTLLISSVISEGGIDTEIGFGVNVKVP